MSTLMYQKPMALLCLIMIFGAIGLQAACPSDPATSDIQYPTLANSEIPAPVAPETNPSSRPAEPAVCDCSKRTTEQVPAEQLAQTPAPATEILTATEPKISTLEETLPTQYIVNDEKTGKKFRVVTLTIPVEDAIAISADSEEPEAEQKEDSSAQPEEVEKVAVENAEQDQENTATKEAQKPTAKSKLSKYEKSKMKKGKDQSQTKKEDKKRSKREAKKNKNKESKKVKRSSEKKSKSDNKSKK